jgi:hypothetical protein
MTDQSPRSFSLAGEGDGRGVLDNTTLAFYCILFDAHHYALKGLALETERTRDGCGGVLSKSLIG